jgi:hypothetical protein
MCRNRFVSVVMVISSSDMVQSILPVDSLIVQFLQCSINFESEFTQVMNQLRLGHKACPGSTAGFVQRAEGILESLDPLILVVEGGVANVQLRPESLELSFHSCNKITHRPKTFPGLLRVGGIDRDSRPRSVVPFGHEPGVPDTAELANRLWRR